ncbi:MAG: tryptophan 2,3-dioxygenase [Sphingobacteriales bacterium]|jgi:tryptophan 2,3-dioxygenase|nr:tryptophan 2,3-dioxygenase [Sphingobacteriales bacterium]MBP9141339.1 tryptophan 2,3-dioxygenase [Chitinophagales bacterium]MDA0198045.1 tryptophan 2,3-dioxygenase family protein [Bacteroidota bacterium]MBK6890725.1 tryptophan 2,3-dioxygenase [Sphingobacteriales bacterium]MBK7526223.1 tryptophan 2,3-dioxygenase [Sphingobacteriales bacterium]
MSTTTTSSSLTNERAALLQSIDQKYVAIDQNTDTHLEGLLWAKPITYWDYILTDSLLNLQIQRTTLPDEMVFIMYHQINELLFKMILWEIDQISNTTQLEAAFFIEKLRRISRYFDMLSNSFDIMGDGMEIAQFLKFRNTLTPASGFQSAQYRMIEFASTELINLIDYRFRATIDRNTPYEHAYDHLYWQAAGKDHATGKKSLLITNFEAKYKTLFLSKMEGYNTTNLYTKYKTLPEATRNNPDLIAMMRHYDYTVNIKWVMAHYHAAYKYIGGGEATGGSDWRKYMLPKYQRRIFFPSLWSADELATWGENEEA